MMTNERMDHNTNFQQRLRGAVQSGAEVPPFLESRIRNRIRQEVEQAEKPRRFRLFSIWAPVALTAGLAVCAVTVYQLGHLRMTAESQESYIATVSNRVATLMRVGLGDHIHCAIFRKRPSVAPTVDEFVRDLGPKYAGLLPIVRQQIPAKYAMNQAHECSYHKRKFVHLSLRGDGNLLSVVIARKGDGESFKTEGFLPALVRSGIPIYEAGVQRFSMHAFESNDFLVYVVSDLPKADNEQMMVALAGPVKDFLNQL